MSKPAHDDVKLHNSKIRRNKMGDKELVIKRCGTQDEETLNELEEEVSWSAADSLSLEAPLLGSQYTKPDAQRSNMTSNANFARSAEHGYPRKGVTRYGRLGNRANPDKHKSDFQTEANEILSMRSIHEASNDSDGASFAGGNYKPGEARMRRLGGKGVLGLELGSTGHNSPSGTTNHGATWPRKYRRSPAMGAAESGVDTEPQGVYDSSVADPDDTFQDEIGHDWPDEATNSGGTFEPFGGKRWQDGGELKEWSPGHIGNIMESAELDMQALFDSYARSSESVCLEDFANICRAYGADVELDQNSMLALMERNREFVFHEHHDSDGVYWIAEQDTQLGGPAGQAGQRVGDQVPKQRARCPKCGRRTAPPGGSPQVRKTLGYCTCAQDQDKTTTESLARFFDAASTLLERSGKTGFVPLTGGYVGHGDPEQVSDEQALDWLNEPIPHECPHCGHCYEYDAINCPRCDKFVVSDPGVDELVGEPSRHPLPQHSAQLASWQSRGGKIPDRPPARPFAGFSALAHDTHPRSSGGPRAGDVGAGWDITQRESVGRCLNHLWLRYAGDINTRLLPENIVQPLAELKARFPNFRPDVANRRTVSRFLDSAASIVEHSRGYHTTDIGEALNYSWDYYVGADARTLPRYMMRPLTELSKRFPNFNPILEDGVASSKLKQSPHLPNTKSDMTDLGKVWPRKQKNPIGTPTVAGTGNMKKIAVENTKKLAGIVRRSLAEATKGMRGRHNIEFSAVLADGNTKKRLHTYSRLAEALADAEELLQVYRNDHVALEASFRNMDGRITHRHLVPLPKVKPRGAITNEGRCFFA